MSDMTIVMGSLLAPDYRLALEQGLTKPGVTAARILSHTCHALAPFGELPHGDVLALNWTRSLS